ncbi:alpha/beta fold hydrolase [Chelatococcus sp. GCM10030263]|uniref:alpha/beta fold hydrolase n=1 Tax=Chelatococcus sp. GCM10030263 TaxID=3273387 RepID=UPI0036101DF8
MAELLHHSVSGLPGAPTLLLIHAMGADSSFWDGCRAIWDARFRTIACDLRGAGRSLRPAAAVTPASHVGDLEALVAHLGPDRLVVVGCAVGAMTAVHYAAAHPERVAGLVLSNPGIRTREAAREALAQRAAAVRRDGMEAAVPPIVDGAFAGCPDDGVRARFVDRFRAQDPTLYAATIEGMLHADVTADLSEIRCPTLLVAGSMDRLLPPEHAEEIKAHLPSAELTIVEGGAHFIPYQRPAEFAGLVEGFMAQHGLTSAAP